MNKPKRQRIYITLSQQALDLLASASERLGKSRSRILEQILAEAAIAQSGPFAKTESASEVLPPEPITA